MTYRYFNPFLFYCSYSHTDLLSEAFGCQLVDFLPYDCVMGVTSLPFAFPDVCSISSALCLYGQQVAGMSCLPYQRVCFNFYES